MDGSGKLLAGVHVESAVYAIDKPYTYLVPEELSASLRRGCRVLVPFGASNKKVQGLVTELSRREAAPPRLKNVAAQLDLEPLLDGELLRIVEYLVAATFCTYYEAVRAVLPIGAGVEVTEIYQWTALLEESAVEALPPGERGVAGFLRTPKTARELREFLGCRQNPARCAQVKALLEKGLIEKSDRIRSRVAKKTVRMIRLREDFDPRAPLSKKQDALVEMLRRVGSAQSKELCYFCGVTEAVVRTLVKKGAAECFEQEAAFLEEPPVPPREEGEIRLSPSQQKAYEGILTLICSKKPAAALLHGVTGSGKTQVYLKLIEQAAAMGRTALMLVPEIALTPQTAARFSARFGGAVAVLHSGLTPAERMDEWNRIRAGLAKIVVGTRSAVFAPLRDIGVIILDEEGESSYKSDSSPRYHAREVAKLRCAVHGATLLLGSATPSVDSYYQAMKGAYSLFTLEERFSRARMPGVCLVDMRLEQRGRNLSPISEVLKEQLSFNLRTGEQSILLLNRRGYHTAATCMQCGEVVKCPYCDAAMTYHKANGRLMCHYCGHTELFCSKCPSCGGEYIKLTGVGTQKVEDELSRTLPGARLLRMDADTTYSKDSYERNFEAFRRGRYDILLGTQMIAKGLDFPNVTLVGVLGADAGLYAGDYRAGERVFSLITQVVGRCGRGEKAGRAYIQTFNPDNPIIGFAASQDYRAFYEDEIASRRAMMLPPFCEIAAIGFAGTEENAVRRAADRALGILKEEAGGASGIVLKVLGVAPAALCRAGGKYRYRLVLKCRMNARMRELLGRVLRRCGSREEPFFSGVSVRADINGDLSG